MTTRYIVFDQASGAAMRWGDCPDSDLELQAIHPGEVVRSTDGPLPVLHIPTLAEFDAAASQGSP